MMEKKSAVHVPVLLREVLRVLDLHSGLVVVDGTLGAAGHAQEIIRRIGDLGVLIGLDRDPMMLKLAASKLPSSERVILRQSSYRELPRILQELNLGGVDRVLLDLGLSSDQLSDQSRGFGFEATGPLDLRFDTSRGIPAFEWLKTVTCEELEQVLREYGEIRESGKIAAHLTARSISDPIQTGSDLANGVLLALGIKARDRDDKHPATQVFQALRIAVNQELEHVRVGLEESVYQSLNPGGLAAIISFHSLEDRIVKQEFRKTDRWETLTSKPIVATYQEQRVNPRSRSAKLRVARRIG